LRYMCKVLMRLRRFSLYANADKCRFFTEEVDFLGFIVGQNGICIDLERVEMIAQWP
jgi:hypothetical protein